jgi:transcriptional regulator NrdR family protein
VYKIIHEGKATGTNKKNSKKTHKVGRHLMPYLKHTRKMHYSRWCSVSKGTDNKWMRQN